MFSWLGLSVAVQSASCGVHIVDGEGAARVVGSVGQRAVGSGAVVEHQLTGVEFERYGLALVGFDHAVAW